MDTYRHYIIFPMIAFIVLMNSLDTTIVIVALPAMLVDLHTTLSWLGWVLTGFMLVSTIVMPLVGRIGDDFGRKRVFIGAVALFTAASFACGFAPNIQSLILFRVAQAIGGGSLMPLGIAIIADHYTHKRAQMIGLVTAITPIGGILGPNVGGWLVQQFSWRAMFYINVPIGVVMGTLAFFLLRRTPRLEKARLDMRGSALLSASVLSCMYAMTRLGESEGKLDDFIMWLSLLLGAIFIVSFVRHEERVDNPILDVALLRWRPFVATNVLNFLVGACSFSIFTMVPTYAVMGFGLSTWESGALLTPRSIGMISMAIVASFLLSRLGYHIPLIGGLLMVALSAVLLGQGSHEVTYLGWPVSSFVLLAATTAINGLGMGLMLPAANNAVIELMPERVGAISGLRGMFRQTGGIVGTSGVLLIMSLQDDKVAALQMVFTGVSVLLVALTPLVLFIPRGRGALRAGRVESI